MIDGKLFKDGRANNRPNRTWEDARNIIKQYGHITPEDGNQVHSQNYPTGYIPVGVVPISDESYILFLVNGSNQSRIGRVVNNVYTDIIVDDALNFNINYPVIGRYKFNNKKELIVSFTDFYNPPRILNIDNLPFPLNPDLSLVDPSQINQLQVFTESIPPVAVSSVLDNGGTVKSGTYYASFSYSDSDDNQTNYHNVFGPIYIADDNQGDGIEQIDGITANIVTNKAIQFSLTNVDQRYKKINLAIIALRDGVFSSFFVKSVDINGSTATITYTGSETTTDILLEEILVNQPLYNKAKAITNIGETLYLGNLEASEIPSLQELANNTVINYNTTIKDLTNVAQTHKINNDKGFVHGEVYAFYLHGILTNGSVTEGYHIPGRPASISNLERSLAVTAQSKGIGSGALTFQVEDTTNSNSPTYSAGPIITSLDNAKSNMGFWENQDEVYPADFPDFAGQKVRHHVFPTINKCKELHYSSNGEYGLTQFDVLGIDVHIQIPVPEELKSVLSGLFISYAKPDIGNSLILGMDKLQFSGNPEDDTTIDYPNGGNWSVAFIQGNNDADTRDNILSKESVRSHCYDLLKNKPAISPTHIALELRMVKQALNVDFDNNTKAGSIVYRTGDSYGDQICGGIAIDYFSGDTYASATLVSTYNSIIHKVNNYKYLLQNTISDKVSNMTIEDNLYLDIDGDDIPYTVGTDSWILVIMDRDVDNNGTIPNAMLDNSSHIFTGGAAAQERSFLYTIRQLRTNVYSSFDNQLLVTTDKIFTDLNQTSFINIHGGNAFISDTSYISHVTNPDLWNSSVDSESGYYVFHRFITESRNNINLRYIDETDDGTKYYPKLSPQEFFTDAETATANFVVDMNEGESLNKFAYNNDYSAVNDVNPAFARNNNAEDIYQFPYRVIGSANGWRKFRENDYYEDNFNRGEIENLAALDDVLMIHHKYGLFRTIGNQTLQTGALEVTIGTGDIFAQQPKEFIPTEHGYLGCQDRLAAFVCKVGYVFPDALNGKIFIVNNSVKEISAEGMNDFFRDNITATGGNPIIGNGMTACFDEKYDRIIVAHNVNGNKFTLSYNIGDEAWISFHDYVPTLLFNTRREVFSSDGSNIWKHNVGFKGNYYNVLYPSYVTLLDNADALIDKLLASVGWVSDVIDSNGNKIIGETFSSIKVENSYQQTIEHPLVPFTGTIAQLYNTRRSANTWYFNKLRDQGELTLKQRRLVDKYFLITLKFNNNILNNTQKTIYLYDWSANKTPILR